ncbi:MAG: hypothetical protein ACE5E1_08785, partial [Phycisphaerae bacterium]
TGCSIADQVVIESIASTLVLPVNTDGRVFMDLRMDDRPHRAATIRLALGEPGVEVSAELFDDGASANFTGLVPTPDMTRRVILNSALAPGSYAVVVALRYDDAELAGVRESELKLQWWNGGDGRWRPATAGASEAASFPIRPHVGDVGRCGVDRDVNIVWAVVDHMGEFSIGVSTGDEPVSDASTPGPAPTPGADGFMVPSAPLCGLFGAPLLSLMLACLCAARSRRRHGLT